MRSINGIVEAALGRSFEIDCKTIKLRGQKQTYIDAPQFFGPGSVGADSEGHFRFRMFDTNQHDPKELIRLVRSARAGDEPMAIDAVDYEGTSWTGAWFIPDVTVSSSGGASVITGEFPQLSTRVPLSSDQKASTTTIYFSETFRLPMTGRSYSQRLRDGEVERVTVHHDRTELTFRGAEIIIEVDEAAHTTMLSTTYHGEWKPPLCEVGLRDAFAFVTAVPAYPRIVVRAFDNDALVFLRLTSKELRTGMPRPIGAVPRNAKAFWDIFLAFLTYCDEIGARDVGQAFYSTPLSRVNSELLPASTGTIHGFVLSLVVAIEGVVTQILSGANEQPSIDELVNHVRSWNGEESLKNRAIGILRSFLSQVSTNQRLRWLVRDHVVTEEQRRLWDDLRQRITHGHLVDYDDERLEEKRLQLISMFNRLALRLLHYRGVVTNYAARPPQDEAFDWLDGTDKSPQ